MTCSAANWSRHSKDDWAVLSADSRLCVPLRQRHAKRYVAGGLALIGDAAHTIHPLAGQGVNLGFLDAAVLAEVLTHAARRGERWSDLRVLGRYERRRMPHNLALMAAMEGFERLFEADPLPLRWLRNTGLKMVNRMPEAKALFVREALGLSGICLNWRGSKHARNQNIPTRSRARRCS